MAFDRTEKQPEGAELTSLIDVVFLLLIFFLVSFAFSLAGDISESKVYSEIELPRTNTELPVLKDDLLENLMIQIVPDSVNRLSARMAYILWPALDDTVKISRSQAFYNAVLDSTFGVFPADFIALSAAEFANLPVCQLISRSISEYVQFETSGNRKKHPIIEVRADQNTEFKILSFIMDECSSHADAVPQIVIRTVP